MYIYLTSAPIIIFIHIKYLKKTLYHFRWSCDTDMYVCPHHSSHFKCFAFYILTTNYYCYLYNNILYLLSVMNKRHSFIRLIQINKELSRCYSYLTKSWHKVINKNSIDNFYFFLKLTILNFGSRRVKRQNP